MIFDRKEYMKAYKEANKEMLKAYRKAWYEANKEKRKAYDKAYQEANKEKRKAYRQAWYKDNKEKRDAYRKTYVENNKEKVIASQKAYREANREKVNARIRDWQQANKEKKNVTNANRRALRFRATVYLTPTDKKEIQNLYKVAQNKTKETGEVWHVDHIIPLTKGGLHKPTNLQVVPASWNLSKGNRTEEKYNDYY